MFEMFRLFVKHEPPNQQKQNRESFRGNISVDKDKHMNRVGIPMNMQWEFAEFSMLTNVVLASYVQINSLEMPEVCAETHTKK